MVIVIIFDDISWFRVIMPGTIVMAVLAFVVASGLAVIMIVTAMTLVMMPRMRITTVVPVEMI